MTYEFLGQLKDLRYFNGFYKTATKPIINWILACAPRSHLRQDMAFLTVSRNGKLCLPTPRNDLLHHNIPRSQNRRNGTIAGNKLLITAGRQSLETQSMLEAQGNSWLDNHRKLDLHLSKFFFRKWIPGLRVGNT